MSNEIYLTVKKKQITVLGTLFMTQWANKACHYAELPHSGHTLFSLKMTEIFMDTWS